MVAEYVDQALQCAAPALGPSFRRTLSAFAEGFRLRRGFDGHVGVTGKSILIEEGEHLGTLIDYVHLNPYRAGLVTVKAGQESYPWPSLTDYS